MVIIECEKNILDVLNNFGVGDGVVCTPISKSG